MSVLGRLLVSSAERLDLPDLLSLDSYNAGDWKFFLKGLVGDTKPYILKGFDIIDPANAIGTQSCAIRVADSVAVYPGSNAGPFYHGLSEGHELAAPLVPELRKNAVNYVYLTFSTFNTSLDTRAFWDSDKNGGDGGEFTQDVNTESVLQVNVGVSTGAFPTNTIPIAKITVGPVVITAIEDARDLLFRLGSGGINPNPFNTYSWKSLPSAGYDRAEPPTEMLSGGINPFQGADKNILTLKEWMDAIMSKLRELGGTTYWYDDTSSFSLINNFYDSVATSFKSKGKWSHSSGTPGSLSWTEDLQIKMTSDPRTYIIRQGSKTLNDEQVMYIPMERNLLFNGTDEDVAWINGQVYINTIGGVVGLFANLTKGDYIKKASDTIDKWVRVEEFYDAVNLGGSTTTAGNARSIRLKSAYLGTTGNEKGRYDRGVYTATDLVVSDRSAAAIANTGGNFHWLAIRSDTIQSTNNITTTSLSIAIDEHDGSTARVTATAHGLVDGDRVTISGTTNFNGTYKVEVETNNIFYITKSGGPFADESGTARYATVTTSIRSTPYGFQEESANHGFNSNDTVAITNTTNYNGTYSINVTSATTFTIPMSSTFATETAGTVTLAKIIVRTEGSVEQIIQGEIVDIAGSAADNIRQFLGMGSLSETYPSYNIPPSYNTLDGMANYNGLTNDSVTSRLSKLTAMMADKAQDKTIQFLGAGYQSISNTTNGSNQDIVFNADSNPPQTLYVVLPGSGSNGTVSMTGTLSLAVDQVAYYTVDRNSSFTVASLASLSIASIADVAIDENTFIFATRLSGDDVWLWNGSRIPADTTVPAPEYQGQTIKLIGGGTITNVGGNSITFDADFYLEKAGLSYADNTISTASSPINFPSDQDVAYVIPNLSAGGPTLTVLVDILSNVPANAVMIARREGTDIIVGSSSSRYITGEAKKLYAGISEQTLTFLGADDAADFSPDYSNLPDISLPYSFGASDSILTAVDQTTGNVNYLVGAASGKFYDEPFYILSAKTQSSYANQLVSDIVTSYDVYDVNWAAQSFQVSTAADLAKVQVKAHRNGNPDFSFRAKIYNDSAGSPGSLIITSTNSIVANTITTDFSGQVVTFDFPLANLTFTPATTYWIVIEPFNTVLANNSNKIGLNGQDPGPYSSGQPKTSTTSGVSWTGGYTSDLYFSVICEDPLAYNQSLAVSSGSSLTIPKNTRLAGNPQQNYTVGYGWLEVYLNGQFLMKDQANGWQEVGALNSSSSTIQIDQNLEADDILTFRINRGYN